MDAIEYLKTIKRMCELHKPICWGEDNHTPCELRIKANAKGMSCSDYTTTFSEEAVAIVEKWTKEHPRKTRQEKFLEMFPNAQIFKEVLTINSCAIDSSRFGTEECHAYDDNNAGCFACRKNYWLETEEE